MQEAVVSTRRIEQKWVGRYSKSPYRALLNDRLFIFTYSLEQFPKDTSPQVGIIRIHSVSENVGI